MRPPTATSPVRVPLSAWTLPPLTPPRSLSPGRTRWTVAVGDAVGGDAIGGGECPARVDADAVGATAMALTAPFVPVCPTPAKWLETVLYFAHVGRACPVSGRRRGRAEPIVYWPVSVKELVVVVVR